MQVPPQVIMVVVSTVFSHCTFVPRYAVHRGGTDVDVKEGETITLLRHGESAEFFEAEAAEDWSELRYKKVRITNEQGAPKIEVLEEGTLERTD